MLSIIASHSLDVIACHRASGDKLPATKYQLMGIEMERMKARTGCVVNHSLAINTHMNDVRRGAFWAADTLRRDRRSPSPINICGIYSVCVLINPHAARARNQNIYHMRACVRAHNANDGECDRDPRLYSHIHTLIWHSAELPHTPTTTATIGEKNITVSPPAFAIRTRTHAGVRQ